MCGCGREACVVILRGQQRGGQRFSWPATSCCSAAPQHGRRPPILDAPYVLGRFCMQHPAKSAQSKSDLREYAGNFRIWFEGRRELRLWQTTPGSAACVLRLPHRPVRPLRAIFCGHSRLLSLCKQVVWCSNSVHRRIPSGILLVSSANSLPAATICCALQGWLGVHRTRPDRQGARGACVGGFVGPWAILAVRTL